MSATDAYLKKHPPLMAVVEETYRYHDSYSSHLMLTFAWQKIGPRNSLFDETMTSTDLFRDQNRGDDAAVNLKQLLETFHQQKLLLQNVLHTHTLAIYFATII